MLPAIAFDLGNLAQLVVVKDHDLIASMRLMTSRFFSLPMERLTVSMVRPR